MKHWDRIFKELNEGILHDFYMSREEHVMYEEWIKKKRENPARLDNDKS